MATVFSFACCVHMRLSEPGPRVVEEALVPHASQSCVWRGRWLRLAAQVLRQVAVAAGLGPVRPRPAHGSRRMRPKQGSAGEDLETVAGGRRSLRMPARFAPGTVKAAAWQACPALHWLFLFWAPVLFLMLRRSAWLSFLGCLCCSIPGNLAGWRVSGVKLHLIYKLIWLPVLYLVLRGVSRWGAGFQESTCHRCWFGKVMCGCDEGFLMHSTQLPGADAGRHAQVLAEAGAGGLPVGEIAERVHTLGLRDMRSSKAPKVLTRAPSPACWRFRMLLDASLLSAPEPPSTAPLHGSSVHDALPPRKPLLAGAWRSSAKPGEASPTNLLLIAILSCNPKEACRRAGLSGGRAVSGPGVHARGARHIRAALPAAEQLVRPGI